MRVEDLLRGIKCVIPGVDQSSALAEGADLVTFEDKWIRSYDGTLSISYPLDTGLVCNVSGQPLYRLLTKLGVGNVRLSVDGNQFILRGQNKRLRLQIQERELEDSIFDLGSVEFQALPEDFAKGIGLCAFSISKDPVLGILTGMNIAGDTLLSSDNYRISRYRMKEKIEGVAIVPIECVAYLMRMERLSHVAVAAPHWIHFKNEDGTVISSVLIGGEYKEEEILRILGVEKAGSYAFPDGLMEAILRAEVLSGEDSLRKPFISMKREGDQLIVVGEQEAVGEYEERMEWESDFPEGYSLQMNPDFLGRILKVTKNFSLDKNRKFIIFNSEEGAFEHLEMARVE